MNADAVNSLLLATAGMLVVLFAVLAAVDIALAYRAGQPYRPTGAPTVVGLIGGVVALALMMIALLNGA